MIRQTQEQLREMKMGAMARAFDEQLTKSIYDELCFNERFGMIVDAEYLHRESKRLERRLKAARLRQNASIDDLIFKQSRGLDKSLIMTLSSCEWIRRHQNLIIMGKTGTGKSFLAEAFANKACRDGYSAFFIRSTKLFEELQIARCDGSYLRALQKISKYEVLVVDDFLVNSMIENERRDFLELLEDRYNRKSTIVTTQYPIADWHAQINGPTLADAILDRLVHNAHKITLQGESLRKTEASV